MDKLCKQCDMKFIAKSKQSLYCSSKCRNQSKKKPRVCEYCGGGFLSKNTTSRFCSNKCGSLNRYKDHHVKLSCEGCGKEFTRIKSKIRYETSFCSFECSQGENKPTRYSSIDVKNASDAGLGLVDNHTQYLRKIIAVGNVITNTRLKPVNESVLITENITIN